MANRGDIGLIGLAVMGENLALNMVNHGFTVSLYNRTTEKIDRFLDGRGKGKSFLGSSNIKEFISSLKAPRKVMLMIKAGDPVDNMIEQLKPHLEKGDIIIDGGNSHYADTDRRVKELEKSGLRYIGMGISGGEEGALNGPSIMPGGSKEAWNQVKPIFQSIAAKAKDGTPCCEWIGNGGSGHFVKMTHNGIEYGDMQLISETYDIMRNLLHLPENEMQNLFKKWNEGKLKSYLIEITSDILGYREDDGALLLDKILDVTAQKGTGKWTVMASLELGTPLTLIAESVSARTLSSGREVRVKTADLYSNLSPKSSGIDKNIVNDLEHALYAAKLISYTQGFDLLRSASLHHNWDLDLGAIALIWREGCIIRSDFLEKISEGFLRDKNLQNLLHDNYFRDQLRNSHESLRKVVANGVLGGIPLPTFSTALSYFDSLRNKSLPANLLQAQRDYFGAHMYERVDKPRGEFFHTNWTGRGGDTSSSTYNA